MGRFRLRRDRLGWLRVERALQCQAGRCLSGDRPRHARLGRLRHRRGRRLASDRLFHVALVAARVAGQVEREALDLLEVHLRRLPLGRARNFECGWPRRADGQHLVAALRNSRQDLRAAGAGQRRDAAAAPRVQRELRDGGQDLRSLRAGLRRDAAPAAQCHFAASAQHGALASLAQVEPGEPLEVGVRLLRLDRVLRVERVAPRLARARLHGDATQRAHADLRVERAASQSKSAGGADDGAAPRHELGDGRRPRGAHVVRRGAVQVVQVADPHRVVVSTLNADRHAAHVIQIATFGKRLGDDLVLPNTDVIVQRLLFERPLETVTVDECRRVYFLIQSVPSIPAPPGQH